MAQARSFQIDSARRRVRRNPERETRPAKARPALSRHSLEPEASRNRGRSGRPLLQRDGSSPQAAAWPGGWPVFPSTLLLSLHLPLAYMRLWPPAMACGHHGRRCLSGVLVKLKTGGRRENTRVVAAWRKHLEHGEPFHRLG